MTDIWGIGKRIAIRLADAGISTVTQLAHSGTTKTSPDGSGHRPGPISRCSAWAATSRRSTTRLTWRRVASRGGDPRRHRGSDRDERTTWPAGPRGAHLGRIGDVARERLATATLRHVRRVVDRRDVAAMPSTLR